MAEIASLLPSALPHISSFEVGVAFAALLVLALLSFSMRTRYYYFVRHGESMLNKEHVKQAGGGSLSPKGRLQAEALGHALRGFHIRRIVSSPYERAVETADIIARIIHAHVSLSALFAERRSPSEIIGKPEHDPDVRRIIDLIDRRYHADEYRYSD
jgi:broad specificity phosphatase PhoE